MQRRVFSGIQPTGGMHLGNYLGAIRTGDAAGRDTTASLRRRPARDHRSCRTRRAGANTREMAAAFLASGIDPEALDPVRPERRAGARRSWPGSSTASRRMGWLNRMTQFKDKAGKDARRAAGLFTYPVLMAADILVYKATHVPVGEDQRQHLELTRDIAGEVQPRLRRRASSRCPSR